MAAVELATGYISLAVSSRGLGRDVARQFSGIEKQSVTTGKRMSRSFATAGMRSGKSFGKSFGSSVGSILKGALGAAVIFKAATNVIRFLGEANAEAVDSIKIGKETARVIKTTGGAAKVTVKDVQKLSEAISNKTGIDDEAVQSSANLLLTFTAVRNEVGKGNDIFNQATGIVQDMSVVFKQDAKASAVQLGKALQDPVKGVSALARVGITFTEQQKKQIKEMVKSGNLLGAQKIILKEIKKQTEGAAAAQTTWSEKATVAWGNIKETIGTFLNKQLEPISKWFVKDGLPAVQNFFDRLSKNKDLKKAITNFKDFLGGVTGDVTDFFKKISKDKALKDAITDLKDALTTLTGDVDFKASLNSIADSLPGIVGGLADIVTKYGEISRAIDKFEKRSFEPSDKVGGPAGQFVKDFGAGGTIERAILRFRVWLPANIKQAYANAKKSFIENHSEIISRVGRFVGRIIGWFANLASRIKATVSGMLASIRDSFIKRTGEVRDKVGSWRTSLVGIANNLSSRLRTSVSGMLASIRDSFFKRTDEVRKKVGGWRDSLLGIARNLSTRLRSTVTNMLADVRTSFSRGVTAIGRAWDKIRAKTETPIKFVVNTVLDDGILKAFRSISKLVGYSAGESFHVGYRKNSDPGNPSVRVATGGILPGYTPGRDVHHFRSATGGSIDLSGGEGIARPEIVKAVGAKRWMAANAAAARGQVHDALEYLGPHLGGFASGGIAAAESYARSIGIRSIGTYPGHHPSQALARDFMTSSRSTGDKMAEWLWTNRKAIHLWYEIYWRRIRSMTRPGSGWLPYTRSNPHTDHVHGAWYPAGLSGAVGALTAAGGVISSGIDISKYLSQITSAIGKLKSIEGTPFGKMVAGIPRKVVGAVRSKIDELVAKVTSSVSGGFTSAGGGSNRAIGKRMMLQKWPASEWPSLNSLWTKESGWRTTARNPSSGAYGIPQSLPASKMASAGADWRTNPATQIKWGLGYIASRYGKPSSAWAHSQRTNWYAGGGVINEPVVGVGLRSGDPYGFGEKGKELVTPLAGNMGASSRGNGLRPITIYLDMGDGLVRKIQDVIDDNDEFRASVGRAR